MAETEISLHLLSLNGQMNNGRHQELIYHGADDEKAEPENKAQEG